MERSRMTDVIEILSTLIEPYFLVFILLIIGIIKYSKEISRAISILTIQFRREKKKIYYDSKLKAIIRVGVVMEKLVNLKTVDLVSLVRLSNGGNNPTVGSKIHLSLIDVKLDRVLYKDISRTSMIEEYDNSLVDNKYIQHAIDASDRGLVKLVVSDMPDQILKSWCIECKIKYLEIHHIYTDIENEVMFLLPIASQSEILQSETMHASIEAKINAIKGDFEKYRR